MDDETRERLTNIEDLLSRVLARQGMTLCIDKIYYNSNEDKKTLNVKSLIHTPRGMIVEVDLSDKKY